MGKRLRDIIPEAVVPYSTHEGNPHSDAPEFKAIVRTATVGPHQLKIIHSVDQPLKGFGNPTKVMKTNYKVDNSYVKRQEIAPNHARDILHTVIHSMKDVIKTHKPDELKFDAVDQDNNPNYEALAHHLARHFGGEASTEMGTTPGNKIIKKFKVTFHRPTNEAVLPYKETIETPRNTDWTDIDHKAIVGDKDHTLSIHHTLFPNADGHKEMRSTFQVDNSFKNKGQISPKNSRDILHTVIHSMKETIATHKPDVVKFEADNQDNNPNYESLSHHLARHFNGQAGVSLKRIPNYGTVQTFHVRLPNHVNEAAIPYEPHEYTTQTGATVVTHRAFLWDKNTKRKHELEVYHSIHDNKMETGFTVDGAHSQTHHKLTPESKRNMIHTVIQSTKDTIERHKPHEVIFYAENPEKAPNYHSFGQHLAKTFGGTFQREANKDVWGDTEFSTVRIPKHEQQRRNET